MSSKASKQKLYKVTLFKTFTYPSCVIDEKNSLRDLHRKAMADFSSKALKNGLDVSEFSIRLDSELPFKVRTSRDFPKMEGTTTDGYSLDYILNELAQADIEQKYGKLDPMSNPSIYIYEEHDAWDDDDDDENESRSGRGEYYLKSEIEEELSERVSFYYGVFKRKLL